MPRLPWVKWFPTDWLADPAVRCCSLAARGLWIDVLCLMHHSPRRGVLLAASGEPITADQLARLTQSRADEVARLLDELAAAGVFSRDGGAVVSRRIRRDEIRRERCSRAGRKGGGNPRLRAPFKPKSATPFKAEAEAEAEAEKKEEPIGSSCPEPARTPASGPPPGTVATVRTVMTFPVVGTSHLREWPLGETKLAEYRQAFTGIDVPAELRRALQWLRDNPGRRKTARGMPAFLGRWLGKAQDDAGRRPTGPRGKGESADSYALGMILDPDGGPSDDARGPQF